MTRIVGHPAYPNSPGTPTVVVGLVRQFKTLPGHHFWPDNISLLDTEIVDASRLLSHTQVTDSYCWRWHMPMAVNWRRSIAAFLWTQWLMER